MFIWNHFVKPQTQKNKQRLIKKEHIIETNETDTVELTKYYKSLHNNKLGIFPY